MNTQRLKVLADHLRHGKLGHEVFDFSVYNAGFPNDLKVDSMNVCGTNGCGIGELPIIFPEYWQFYGISIMPINANIRQRGLTSLEVAKFFEIDHELVSYMFTPGRSIYHICKYGSLLPENATKEMVADRIEEVIALDKTKMT